MNSKIDFHIIIKAIFKYRWFILIPSIVSPIIFGVSSFFLPRIYETSSLVLVTNRKIVDPLVSGIGVPQDLREELNTLSKQVMTWPRLEQLVTQLHLADNVKSPVELENFIKALKSRIQVGLRGKDIIMITYQDRNPEITQKVVNTLTMNFIDENARIKKQDAINAIDFINEQLKIYRKKLEESQNDFSTNKIDSDLRIARNHKRLLEDRMTNIQKMVPSQITSEQNPVVGRLQSRLGELETEMAKLMVDAKESNPKVIELKKQIQDIKSKINDETGKETVKERVSMMNPAFLSLEQEIKQVDMEIGDLAKKKRELNEKGERPDKKVTEEELANLARSKRIDEDIYQMLLRQLEAAYVTERLQDSDKVGRFNILEYARLPLTPVKPNKFKFTFMGIVVGLGFGGGLAFLLEYMDKSFKTIQQAKKALPMTFMGVISKITDKSNRGILESLLSESKIFSKMQFIPPHFAKKIINTDISPSIIMYHDPKTRIAEEFRIVKTNIENFWNDHLQKTIMLTSALYGEGKSTTSANIAVALANSGKNTLIIDCDLRKATIHNLFAVPQSPGLANILIENADVEKTLIKSEIQNLTILPAGNLKSDPSDLIASNNMVILMDYLKQKFERIVIDSPPVLNLPDTSVISKYADGVLMIVQTERTLEEDVINAKSTLEQSRSKIMGFVMTNVQYYTPRYIYDYYYRETA